MNFLKRPFQHEKVVAVLKSIYDPNFTCTLFFFFFLLNNCCLESSNFSSSSKCKLCSGNCHSGVAGAENHWLTRRVALMPERNLHHSRVAGHPKDKLCSWRGWSAPSPDSSHSSSLYTRRTPQTWADKRESIRERRQQMRRLHSFFCSNCCTLGFAFQTILMLRWE